ncbi:MAG: hypothetical protein Q4D91_13250 [Lautropia sp.]|nr:hypothetical protein [Lautropia sp.]
MCGRNERQPSKEQSRANGRKQIKESAMRGVGSSARDQCLVEEGKVLLSRIQKRWAILSLWVFILSLVAVANYFIVERIPLSYTSPDVLGALPAVFISIVFGVALVVGGLVFPVPSLLSDANSTCKRKKVEKGVCYYPVLNRKTNSRVCVYDRLVDPVGWCRVGLACCLYYFLGVVVCGFLFQLGLDGGWGVWLTLFSMYFFIFIGGVLFVFMIDKEGFGGLFSVDRLLILFAVSCYQFIVVVSVSFYFYSYDREGGAAFLVVLFFAQVLLSMVCIFLIRQELPLSFYFVLGAILVTAVSVFPDASRLFVSVVFSRQVMGGADCVELGWSGDMKVSPDIVGGVAHEGQEVYSKGLRVLYASSSTLYVRLLDDWKREQEEGSFRGVTYQIAQSAIIKHARCRK